MSAAPIPAQEFVGGDELAIRDHYFEGRGSATSVDADGAFVVVWNEPFYQTMARGVLPSDEFASGGSQLEPIGLAASSSPVSIASLSRDDFLVVWEDVYEEILWGRRYSGSVAPLDSEFVVRANPNEMDPIQPDLSARENSFLVVWSEQDEGSTDPDSLGIKIKAIGASSTRATGSPFEVNVYTPGDQDLPSVASNAEGDFIVVWRSDGSPGDDDSGLSIQGRLNLEAQFQVNSQIVGDQSHPSAALSPSGPTLVVWHGPSMGEPSRTDIQGRLFDTAGVPATNDFLVNQSTASSQRGPAVDALPGLGFVVVWTTDTGVYGRLVKPDGSLPGDQFRVNLSPGTEFMDASLEAGEGGQFVVSWLRNSSGRGVVSRRFRHLLFEDDFESGDTSGWSVTVP